MCMDLSHCSIPCLYALQLVEVEMQGGDRDAALHLFVHRGHVVV
jgi:hypothetical protein